MYAYRMYAYRIVSFVYAYLPVFARPARCLAGERDLSTRTTGLYSNAGHRI